MLEDDGRVVGYAYGGPHQSRPAYRWACEVSVYLERGRRRTGGGRALYEALFLRLAERGFRTAVAGMTLPNDESVGLHLAMGFEPVGTYRHIGWKLHAWRDVTWAQPTIATGQDPPADPRCRVPEPGVAPVTNSGDELAPRRPLSTAADSVSDTDPFAKTSEPAAKGIR